MRTESNSVPNLPRRQILVTALVSIILLACAPAIASASAFQPPAGKIFTGETGDPVSSYTTAAGKSPAVFQIFAAWGEYLPAIFADAARAHARLMLHITTAFGSREAITPGQIARGDGDAWLIALNHAAYQSGLVVYVRLMAEMDGYWNPYCAFNADGTSRGPDHSAAAYKRAFKRVALIMRGGSLAHIDAVLHRLGMPPLHASGDLDRPAVAMAWVPQTAGDPAVPGNQPAAYFPGRNWVDWVGTDFYGKFPNFAGLNSFYAAYPGYPFLFGEYALWGADDPGFIDQLFGWIGSHPRTQMLVYNQVGGPFQLWRYPRAARALRAHLAGAQFLG